MEKRPEEMEEINFQFEVTTMIKDYDKNKQNTLGVDIKANAEKQKEVVYVW